MDIGAYRKYMEELIQEAMDNSDGTNSGISEYLREKQVSGWFVRKKKEKQRALADARKAFDEHAHWPVDIVISHLGVDPKEVGAR